MPSKLSIANFESPIRDTLDAASTSALVPVYIWLLVMDGRAFLFPLPLQLPFVAYVLLHAAALDLT